VLWLGPPGLGKSHLVQAIGYQAVKAGYTVLYRSVFDLVRDFLHDEVLGQEDKMLTMYLKPELLIIDDMGMKQLPRRSGECLFEVVMRRYETRSTMMTSNRHSGPQKVDHSGHVHLLRLSRVQPPRISPRYTSPGV
jgi:DNA replication protein DnaC